MADEQIATGVGHYRRIDEICAVLAEVGVLDEGPSITRRRQLIQPDARTLLGVAWRLARVVARCPEDPVVPDRRLDGRHS